MAAKSPAAKKSKSAKNVKTSKTAKSKSHFTSRQRQAGAAAYTAALKAAGRAQRANTIASHRIQAAAKRAVGRQKYAARTKARIVRNTYLQVAYGNQRNPVSGVPLRSRLIKPQSLIAYLQARYGLKTYPLTVGGNSSVRVKPRVKKGRVVAAGKTAVSRPRTNRTALAKANAAMRRTPKQATPTIKPRKAAAHAPVVTSEWITAGNDDGIDNCVAVAIANHLLYHTGKRLPDPIVNYLRWETHVAKALERIDYGSYWKPVSMEEYGMVYLDEVEPGMIIGFECENGSHCGLLLPDSKVVSWGEIIPLESPIEEAWTVTWTTKTS